MVKESVSKSEALLWNMVGSLSTAAISVLLLLVVSRFLGNKEADTFSFAYSLGHLFVIIGLFQVRNYQATDVLPKYNFKTYFFVRVITTALMILVILGYLLWNNYDSEKSKIIFLISLTRLIDALSDVFQGFFQQQERLDIAGKSLFYRNCFHILGFTIVLWFSYNLVIALWASVMLSVLAMLLFDLLTVVNYREHLGGNFSLSSCFVLLKETFPLFATGFLIAFIYNQPKYVLDFFMNQGYGVEGLQKDFNILFMPIFVMNLMILFFRPQVTQLAIFEQKGDLLAFNNLKRKIIYLLILLSIGILLLSYWLGLPILGLVFGTDLSKYQIPFMLLMLGGIMSAFAMLFDNLLTILRKQKLLLIPYTIAFFLTIALSERLIFAYGILGASYGFILSMFAWLLSISIIYLILEKKMFKEI